jgi:hypothetical protein
LHIKNVFVNPSQVVRIRERNGVYAFAVGKLKERSNFEDPVVKQRVIIIRWIFRKLFGRMD